VETINRFQQIERQLIQDLGREPLPEEIAAEMGETVAKVRHIRKISQDTVSLETSVGDDDEDSKLEDFLEDTKTISPDRQAARELLRDYVQIAMDGLTPREQKILEMDSQMECHTHWKKSVESLMLLVSVFDKLKPRRLRRFRQVR